MNIQVSENPIVYFNKQFVLLADARVNVLTHALNYGTAVFEGIRGYWNAEQEELFLLRPVEHYDRWKGNCGIIRIGVGVASGRVRLSSDGVGACVVEPGSRLWLQPATRTPSHHHSHTTRPFERTEIPQYPNFAS